MSRIVSRSEQEPLMRLQRPSSASSQDTAHLVNACLRHFLENSSTPVPMLDRGKVDNLRVSSAEQREGYHKRYVELLKTVCLSDWVLFINRSRATNDKTLCCHDIAEFIIVQMWFKEYNTKSAIARLLLLSWWRKDLVSSPYTIFVLLSGRL